MSLHYLKLQLINFQPSRVQRFWHVQEISWNQRKAKVYWWSHSSLCHMKATRQLLPCMLISRQTPVQPGFLCILPWSRRLPAAARRTLGWPNDPDLHGSPSRHVHGNLRVLGPDEEGCRTSLRSSSSPQPRSASAPCRRRWWRAATG